MRLTTLLQEIERSTGPVTGIELAVRMGVSPGEIATMLDALRAAGKLGANMPERLDTCTASGSCSMTCPGPDQCSLTVNLQVSNLQIRGYADSSSNDRSEAT